MAQRSTGSLRGTEGAQSQMQTEEHGAAAARPPSAEEVEAHQRRVREQLFRQQEMERRVEQQRAITSVERMRRMEMERRRRAEERRAYERAQLEMEQQQGAETLRARWKLWNEHKWMKDSKSNVGWEPWVARDDRAPAGQRRPLAEAPLRCDCRGVASMKYPTPDGMEGAASADETSGVLPS